MSTWSGTPVIAGAASGVLLRFDRPISLWGGVDPGTGRVSDPRHPQHGENVSGRVVALPATVGSSSSSYIMLELIANGCAPAAVIVTEPDAILSLGVIVAREMGYAIVPVIQMPLELQRTLPVDIVLRVDETGAVAAS